MQLLKKKSSSTKKFTAQEKFSAAQEKFSAAQEKKMSSLTVDDLIALIQETKGDKADFLTKHGAWLLTVIGVATGAFSALLVYFLKSRCKKISCWGLRCDREVLELDPNNVDVTSSTAES